MNPEILLSLLEKMIPKEAFKNCEIEVSWENESENVLLIFIKITRKVEEDVK